MRRRGTQSEERVRALEEILEFIIGLLVFWRK
jgi:hypothetical protein